MARGAWQYLDFYMGTLGMDRDELAPIYELIFARMRDAGLDWRYVHPRLYLADFGDLGNERDAFGAYDPSESVSRELERQHRAAETADLRAELNRAYRESVEEARANPPPAVDRSYQRIYGRDPEGWPPS